MTEEKLSFITAEEARSLAEKSRFFINNIYKAIKDAAKRNLCEIGWDAYNVSKKVIDDALLSLKTNGYTAEYIKEDRYVKISW